MNYMVFPNKFIPPCSMANLEVDNLYSIATEITDLEVNNNLEVNGSVFINNGTVSNPALKFLTSVNTGIYKPANQTLGIVANSSEKMRISGTQTNLTMPLNIGNTLLNPVDYVRFSNVGGETQVKVVGNSDCLLSFENGLNDNDFSLGIDLSQNAFLKSKTNLKIQDEKSVDSVEISKDKNGIKLYNNVVGYTASNLDYYEDVIIPDVIVSGGVSPITLSGIRFIRCGKMVCMYLPEISVSGNNSPLTITNLVPTRFLPSTTSNFYVVSFDTVSNPTAPNQSNGHCDLNSSTGTAIFYRGPNHLSFTVGSVSGIRASYLNWMTT